MATAGVFLWVILMGISALLAYLRFGKRRTAIFLPALIINLAATIAPVFIIVMMNARLGY